MCYGGEIFSSNFQSFKDEQYLQEKNVKMSDETRERPLNGEGVRAIESCHVGKVAFYLYFCLICDLAYVCQHFSELLLPSLYLCKNKPILED